MNNIITGTIITIGLIVIAYIASMSFNSWTRTQGVATCINGGRTETTIVQGEQVQKYIQPDGAWYSTCLKDMGLRDKTK